MDRGMEFRATAKNRAKDRMYQKRYGKEWLGNTSIRFRLHVANFPEFYGKRPSL